MYNCTAYLFIYSFIYYINTKQITLSMNGNCVCFVSVWVYQHNNFLTLLLLIFRKTTILFQYTAVYRINIQRYT